MDNELPWSFLAMYAEQRRARSDTIRFSRFIGIRNRLIMGEAMENPYDYQIMLDCVESGFKVSDVYSDPYDSGRRYKVFPEVPPIPAFEDFDDQIKFWFVDPPEDLDEVAIISNN